MQACRNGAAGVASDQPANEITGGDLLTFVNYGNQRLIGCPQPASMIHAHHATASDLTREMNGSDGSGSYRHSRDRTEIHAAVAGEPRLRRRIEPAHHGWRPVERPSEPTSRPSRGSDGLGRG